MRTAQEVFDTVANHLRKQGKRAMLDIRDGSTCAYRGEGGTMCAVGCLIPDDVYVKSMEGMDIHKLTDAYQKRLPVEIIQYSKLLKQLQLIHDNWRTKNVSDLDNELKQCATNFKLTYTE